MTAKEKKGKAALDILTDKFNASKQNLSLKTYQNAKAAIRDLCCGYQPNDRLPSIRDISRALGAAPVPVQRAITELIAEDILYAKSGIGLFLKKTPEKYPVKFIGHHTLHRVQDLVFLFKDSSDAKREIMLNIVQDYRACRSYNSNLPSVKLIFERNEEADANPDMVAMTDCSSKFLDLSDFGNYEIRKGNLEILGKYAGIMAYFTAYLYYNVGMLKKLGIEKPAYSNFEEQTAYMRKTGKIIAAAGLMSPLSWNQPHYFLGRHIPEIISFLKGSEAISSPAGLKISGLFEKLLAYYRLFSYEGAGSPPGKTAFEWFLNTQTPLFSGPDFCVMELKEHADFEWMAYPVFTCDDTVPLLPLYVTVDAATRLPVECVKLLMYMQSPSAQKRFHEQGLITVRREGKYLIPERGHGAAAQKSFAVYMEQSEDNYVFEHILGLELLEAGFTGKSISDTFEKIIDYSRSYFRHFANK